MKHHFEIIDAPAFLELLHQHRPVSGVDPADFCTGVSDDFVPGIARRTQGRIIHFQHGGIDDVADGNPHRRLAEGTRKLLLTLSQRLFRLLALPAQPFLLQRMTDRLPEARQPVLHQIIHRTQLDRGDRNVFTHGPGHHNHRQLRITFPADPQCGRRIKTGHDVVAQNDVPLL